jgi:hypothetical protein
MHSMNERLIINLTLNSSLKTCLMFLVSLTCSTNLFFKLRKKVEIYIHAKGFFFLSINLHWYFFVNFFVVSIYVFKFNYLSSNLHGLLQAINHLILAKQIQRLVKTSIHPFHIFQPSQLPPKVCVVKVVRDDVLTKAIEARLRKTIKQKDDLS